MKRCTKACLASSAIRCRDVETGPTLGVLAVLSLQRCHLPVPPSLHGVSWAQCPRFGGTMRTLRLLAAHPPALRCLRPAVTIRAPAVRSVGRQVRRPRPLRRGEMTFRPTHDVGPRTQCIAGLNHAAYGLPVNASRPWVTPGPRITRFRLAADLGRMGLDTHRVSNKVSKITSRHLVPLDRAFPAHALLHEDLLWVGRRGPRFWEPSAGATLQG